MASFEVGHSAVAMAIESGEEIEQLEQQRAATIVRAKRVVVVTVLVASLLCLAAFAYKPSIATPGDKLTMLAAAAPNCWEDKDDCIDKWCDYYDGIGVHDCDSVKASIETVCSNPEHKPCTRLLDQATAPTCWEDKDNCIDKWCDYYDGIGVHDCDSVKASIETVCSNPEHNPCTRLLDQAAAPTCWEDKDNCIDKWCDYYDGIGVHDCDSVKASIETVCSNPEHNPCTRLLDQAAAPTCWEDKDNCIDKWCDYYDGIGVHDCDSVKASIETVCSNPEHNPCTRLLDQAAAPTCWEDKDTCIDKWCDYYDGIGVHDCDSVKASIETVCSNPEHNPCTRLLDQAAAPTCWEDKDNCIDKWCDYYDGIGVHDCDSVKASIETVCSNPEHNPCTRLLDQAQAPDCWEDKDNCIDKWCDYYDGIGVHDCDSVKASIETVCSNPEHKPCTRLLDQAQASTM